MGTLAKIRRLHLREGVPIKEIQRRTGLARNTIRSWLRKGQMVEPKYPPRVVASKLDAYAEQLAIWLKADAHRGKRDRRTVKLMYEELAGQGYKGGYGRVAAFARRWREQQAGSASKGAFVPLKFALGEAFQLILDNNVSCTAHAGSGSGWPWRRSIRRKATRRPRASSSGRSCRAALRCRWAGTPPT